MNAEGKMGSGVRKMSTGRNLLNFRVNQAALAYAMTTLGASMINNIFSFYYVKLFINKYKTSETDFHQSQVRISFIYSYAATGRCFIVCSDEPCQTGWGLSITISAQWFAPISVCAFSTVGVHGVERAQRPSLWLPARHLENELLLSAPPVHPVWSSTLFADFPAALVPMEVLLPWRLVERHTPDGGSLRFRWPAHLCASGTMRAVCRDLQQPSESTPTAEVQPGTSADP